MRKQTVSVPIEAPALLVFEVIHDYSRRLAWDSLLSQAMVLPPDTQPDVGVGTRCVGTWTSCWMVMDTRYVSFQPGRVAAVTLAGRTWLFESFHATIRHEAIDEDRSRVDYIYSFACRPKWLAWLVEPVVNVMLRRETVKRLASLRTYVETRQQEATP